MSRRWRVQEFALVGGVVGAVCAGIATAVSEHRLEIGYFVGAMAGCAFCGGFLFTLFALTRDAVRDFRHRRR